MITFHAKTAEGWWIHPNYEVMQFPAGEWFIKNHNEQELVESYAYITAPTADDIVIASLWVNLAEDYNRRIAILLPYLPGARDDKGHFNGAGVYADLLNTLGAQIRYVDPHSHILPTYLDNGLEIPVHRVIERATKGPSGYSPYMGVIAPDKGAVDRAALVARRLEVGLTFAAKERNQETGKLSHFVAPDLAPGHYLIVDDICDGGGTFMGLADAIQEKNSGVTLDLWVTHGVFSGNAREMLPQKYNRIFTTDSFPQTDTDGFTVIPLLPTLLGG